MTTHLSSYEESRFFHVRARQMRAHLAWTITAIALVTTLVGTSGYAAFRPPYLLALFGCASALAGGTMLLGLVAYRVLVRRFERSLRRTTPSLRPPRLAADDSEEDGIVPASFLGHGSARAGFELDMQPR